jgi:hypothetical protein
MKPQKVNWREGEATRQRTPKAGPSARDSPWDSGTQRDLPSPNTKLLVGGMRGCDVEYEKQQKATQILDRKRHQRLPAPLSSCMSTRSLSCPVLTPHDYVIKEYLSNSTSLLEMLRDITR